MRSLRECLSDYDTVLLEAIAEKWGFEPDTNRRPDMVDEIVAEILDPEAMAETLAWLDEREREALDALLVNGGRMRAHRFEQRFGAIRRFGPGRMAREAPWRSPISPAEGLWYRGLIARGFAQEQDTVVEFVFIPSEIASLLPPPQATPEPFVVPVADEPARVVPGDPAMVDDLCTLLAWTREHPLHLRGGTLQEADELMPRLLLRDRVRLEFMLHIALKIGLLRPGKRVLRVGHERMRGWLLQTRARQLLILQQAWRDDATWNDLWHVPGIRCEDTGWRNDPVRARNEVLGLLRRCADGEWLSIEGFVQAVREQCPDYLRPDGDFDSWYIRDARTGRYLTGIEHWEQVEGALLVYLLTAPLHWLGIVSLGYREGWARPSAVRLTPWGRAFLGLESLPEAKEQTRARVTPEGTVTIARESPLRDRFQLARIADWQASGEEYLYALTPGSLGRALDAGIGLERVERFLRRITGDHVQAAAIARLRAWAGRYGHVRMRRAAILETRTPELMKELRANERIRGYLRETLSPTVSLVRDSDWSLLIQELHRAGYLPQIQSSGTALPTRNGRRQR